jgi:hypothetical protein
LSAICAAPPFQPFEAPKLIQTDMPHNVCWRCAKNHALCRDRLLLLGRPAAAAFTARSNPAEGLDCSSDWPSSGRTVPTPALLRSLQGIQASAGSTTIKIHRLQQTTSTAFVPKLGDHPRFRSHQAIGPTNLSPTANLEQDSPNPGRPVTPRIPTQTHHPDHAAVSPAPTVFAPRKNEDL